MNFGSQAFARAGVGGPLSAGNAKDQKIANAVNSLRANPHGSVTITLDDGTKITLHRDGSRVTGTITNSYGSISVSGTYSDTPGKAQVAINNLSMTPSVGKMSSSPSQMTLSTNTNNQILLSFNKDVTITLFVIGDITPYNGGKSYAIHGK